MVQTVFLTVHAQTVWALSSRAILESSHQCHLILQAQFGFGSKEISATFHLPL